MSVSAPPFLTIVVTTHRRPRKLALALQSIRDQGAFPVEVVLCDDAGCAETRRVAADLLGEGDVFISRPGMRGPAESRNAGIEVASAPWIGFLDDDDLLAPGWFKALAPRLADPRPRVIFGDFMLCDADGRKLRRLATGVPPLHLLRVRNIIHSAAFVMPRGVSARFDASLRSHEDWDFLLSLFADIPFEYLPVLASEYRAANFGCRNNVFGDDLAADYQAVYERHPVSGARILAARQVRLREMSLIRPIEQG